jgi:hypothetical protein
MHHRKGLVDTVIMMAQTATSVPLTSAEGEV